MSERNRTKDEYVEMYAHDYCNNDTDAAKEHEIVKEVCEELKESE